MATTTTTDPTRRQFLGLLGTGTAASAGLAGPTSAQETPTIAMGNNYFDPIGLYVEPGTTVRFEIEAGSHSVTAYDDRIPAAASPFDSGVLSAGSFEYTFDTPGTYDYYCIPHRSMGMVGRIIVGEPGGPAEATPIPDGDVPESEVILEQETVAIDQFDESDDNHGGMMGSSPGMNGGGPGWMILMPLGFLILVIGLAGGTAYWVARRVTAGASNSEAPPENQE